jgi:hypothetical protein
VHDVPDVWDAADLYRECLRSSLGFGRRDAFHQVDNLSLDCFDVIYDISGFDSFSPVRISNVGPVVKNKSVIGKTLFDPCAGHPTVSRF